MDHSTTNKMEVGTSIACHHKTLKTKKNMLACDASFSYGVFAGVVLCHWKMMKTK
jgi:hypothetical protein